MPRPIWSGYISFGLVSIPVVLQSAENKVAIRFKLIDSRDKAKIRYLRVNEETGKEVPWKDIAKGYEYDDNDFVVLKDQDLKNMAEENSKTINIEAFINKKELDIMSYEKPYYLIPEKKGAKGYVILREILASTNKVGIAKVIIHTKQYLTALIPYKNALLLYLLRYFDEIRKPEEFDFPSNNLKEYKISNKELEIAKQLIASMSSAWKPNQYHDEYREMLQNWLDKRAHTKQGSTKTKKSKPTTSSNIINFVDLLKKSIKEKKDKKGKSNSHKSKKKAK